MSGGDDDEMSQLPDAWFYGPDHAPSPNSPTAGDDGHVVTPRQSVDAFESKLGPVCYDLIKNRLRPIIESGGKIDTLGGTAGATVQRATMDLQPTMPPGMFSYPLMGYGMICIFRQPKPPAGPHGPWLKRKAFTLWASSVEITDYLGAATARYPQPQYSTFVKIDDVENVVRSLPALPRFKFILLYFNTTDHAQTVRFNISELPAELQESIWQYNEELGIGNDVEVEPQKGKLVIFNPVGTSMLPGSDRGWQALPDKPADWNTGHVAQWMEPLGVDPSWVETINITGPDLLEMRDIDEPINEIASTFNCTKSNAAKIKEAVSHLGDAPMEAAFTDLCTL